MSPGWSSNKDSPGRSWLEMALIINSAGHKAWISKSPTFSSVRSVLHLLCAIILWNNILQSFVLATTTWNPLSMLRPGSLRVSPNSLEVLRKDSMSIANRYQRCMDRCSRTPRDPQTLERRMLALNSAMRSSSTRPPITLPQDQSPNMQSLKAIHTSH